MILKTFKDLSAGDQVRFRDLRSDGSEIKSGTGTVIGFGESGFTDLVWIRTEDDYEAIPYRQVEKQ